MKCCKSRFHVMAYVSLTFLAAMVVEVCVADELAQVTVTATRPSAKTVGQSPRGASIEEVTLQRYVSYADLDLGTRRGARMLEARVKDTARASCKELELRDPITAPDAKQCLGRAVESAMIQVRAAVAAAQRPKPHTP
jgi:UrcA family protein